VIKRIKGIRRAALAPYIPNMGNGFVLIDCGANVECTPEYLLQFAFMGTCYSREILGIKNPRVGILNIGTEETKGLELQKNAGILLKKAAESGKINFVGNVEAREAMTGVCDVLVTDGFTGNVFLKGMEGVGLFMLSEIRKAFTSSFMSKIAGAIMKKRFAELRKKMDSSETGGTVMLGISKPVVKAHGSSDAHAIRSAIMQAIRSVESNVVGSIKKDVEFMKSVEEQNELTNDIPQN
jgi:glycerol-3-phosphate acyltransferase PlsX